MFTCTGTSAIQNDQTRSKSSLEDVVLSASAYSGPEKTVQDLDAGSLNFQTTPDAFKLDSSRRSFSDIDKDENYDENHEIIDRTRFKAYNNNNEATITLAAEPIDDALTSSKLIDQIDGNQIEVKPGEYYR